MGLLLIVLGGVVVAIIAGFTIMHMSSKKQMAEREALLRQQRKPYKMLAADFARVGWPVWGYASHCIDGQDDRIQRAIKSRQMKVIEYERENHAARIQGESGDHYTITPQGCSCPDFAKRGLPCKHMYFAVMEISEDA